LLVIAEQLKNRANRLNWLALFFLCCFAWF